MRFICFFILVFFSSLILNAAEQKTVIESKDWGFNGPFGKFDKESLEDLLERQNKIIDLDSKMELAVGSLEKNNFLWTGYDEVTNHYQMTDDEMSDYIK